MPRYIRSTPVRSIADRNQLALTKLALVWAVVNRMPAIVRQLGTDEDAFHAGFLGLLNAASLWDPLKLTRGKPVAFSTYAVFSIRNAIIQASQRERLVRHATAVQAQESPSGNEGEPFASPEPDPFEHEDLRWAIRQLPWSDQRLLRDRFWRNMGTEAMAAERGCHRETVLNRLRKAVERLRVILSREAA
jgi:RNA polymerase sigma factor (sigma-70 family)